MLKKGLIIYEDQAYSPEYAGGICHLITEIENAYMENEFDLRLILEIFGSYIQGNTSYDDTIAELKELQNRNAT